MFNAQNQQTINPRNLKTKENYVQCHVDTWMS